jgi:hypothetical protein
MTRASAKKQQQQQQPTTSSDDASPAISKDVYDKVVARVAELEAQVTDERMKLTQAAKDVSEAVAKASVAEAARREDAEVLTRMTVERDGAVAEAANQVKLAALQAELTARNHADALAAAAREAEEKGAAAQAAFDEQLASTRAELAAEQLARQEAEARFARRTSGGSAKKARKSNWPVPDKSAAADGQAPINECAATFLEDAGGVRVQGRRCASKVEVNFVSRPFQVAGSGAEDFFASLNVTDQASLHKLVYESGYWWNIASFAGAPYNADTTKPCQCIDVLKYVQHETKFEIDGQACATRKVWLAMHLWPDCDAMKDGSIKNLSGSQQSLLKKYVTGINQMTNFYNKFMADTDGFTPLAATAPPPERKSGTKRAREDEGEGEGEAQTATDQDEPMGGAEPPIVTAELVEKPADDEAMPPIAFD